MGNNRSVCDCCGLFGFSRDLIACLAVPPTRSTPVTHSLWTKRYLTPTHRNRREIKPRDGYVFEVNLIFVCFVCFLILTVLKMFLLKCI